MSKKKIGKRALTAALLTKADKIGKRIALAYAGVTKSMQDIAMNFAALCKLCATYNGHKRVAVEDVALAKKLIKKVILATTGWKEKSYAPAMSKLVKLAKLPMRKISESKTPNKRNTTARSDAIIFIIKNDENKIAFEDENFNERFYDALLNLFSNGYADRFLDCTIAAWNKSKAVKGKLQLVA